MATPEPYFPGRTNNLSNFAPSHFAVPSPGRGTTALVEPAPEEPAVEDESVPPDEEDAFSVYQNAGVHHLPYFPGREDPSNWIAVGLRAKLNPSRDDNGNHQSKEGEGPPLEEPVHCPMCEKAAKDAPPTNQDSPNIIQSSSKISWLNTCVMITKGSLTLSLLLIPWIYTILGLFPGMIMVLTIEFLVTWGSMEIRTFEKHHPDVDAIADVGYYFGGRIGRELLGAGYFLFLFLMASAAIASFSVSLNAISRHSAPTFIFMGVAAIIGLVTAAVRNLTRMPVIGWIGCVCILASVFTLIIALAVGDRPMLAPAEGPWEKNIILWNAHPGFVDATNAASKILFVAGTTPGYFGIISDMRRPREFKKAVLISQLFVTVLFIGCSLGVYLQAGQYIAMPVLGTAGGRIKQICYLIAFPGSITLVGVYCHLPAKYVYVRLFHGTPYFDGRGFRSWAFWFLCTFTVVAGAYLIAAVVEDYGHLASLVGAVICPSVCLIPYALMLYNDRNPAKNRRKALLHTVFAAFVVLLSIYWTVGGTYAAIVTLIEADTVPFSSADNSVENGTG